WEIVSPSETRCSPLFTNQVGECLFDSDVGFMLNIFFSSVFTQKTFFLPLLPQSHLAPISPISFTSNGIAKIIDNRLSYCAAGEDGILLKILKMVTSQLTRTPLSFNKFLNAV
ncbi:MAG: hypothetical protein O7D30_06615, partial [Rickettsia endosymbiont of Ixodes persulcatus]|nr:hypothetical protein [Rickettsia endosymbiont of Ixodes persulcatus]